MEKRRYDEEFKDNAVKMLLTSGRALVSVARDLGISDTALRRWRNAYFSQAEGRHPGGERMPSVREMAEEIKKLQKQLAEVTWQRDILKKTASILAERPMRDTR